MIEQLTAEQEAMLPVYRDKWLKIGLSCEPLDFEAAKKAASKAYEAAGLEPPVKFYKFRSPLEAARGTASLKGEPDQVRAQLSAQIYGNHDASWLSLYDFFRHECGLESCSRLDGLIELAQCCGWWAPYRGVAVFQDRPESICWDDQHRTHNEDGPAIVYRDGLSVYCYHGIRVDRDLIEHKDKITVEQIHGEANAEIKRIMLELFGVDRYLDVTQAECISNDEYGKLYKLPFNELELSVVRVVNSTTEEDGTNKIYFLSPQPGSKTAHGAVASTFGMTPENYNPVVET